MSSTRPPSYDERFAVPVEASRRGAHRARVSPGFAFLPYVAIAAVVLGVGALAWTLVGSSLFGGSSGSGAQGGGGASSSPSVSRSTAPASSTSSPSSSTSTSPTGSGSPSSTATVPAGVDQTVAITVLNGSSPTFKTRSGLAGRAVARLTGAGWTGALVSKKAATSAGTTVVYYGTTELKPAALAVVQSLGVGKARYSPARAGKAIVVIMSDDYTG